MAATVPRLIAAQRSSLNPSIAGKVLLYVSENWKCFENHIIEEAIVDESIELDE
jgi:hypothetical protein